MDRMKAFRRLGVFVLFGSSMSVCAMAQPPAARLEIVRDNGAPLIVTSAELSRMPHVPVQGMDHGKPVAFSGVPLLALLKLAGVPVDSVRGLLIGSVVVASAADGYRATFSLGELAPGLGRTTVFVIDQAAGAPLATTDGPLRLVVPDDLRPARWVRQLVRISVRRAEP